MVSECFDQTFLRNLDFGNEAGDDASVADLMEYFVEQDSFLDFIKPKHRLQLATARKGMGKSALLRWAAAKVQEEDSDALVISVRGTELVRSQFNLTSILRNANDYSQDWMVRICALINRHLAMRCKIALTDDAITLVETAELQGYRQRNLCGCLIDRLSGIVVKNAVKKIEITNEIEMLKRVKDRNVWVFIDDLDATYQHTVDEKTSLATFFSACRYLMQDFKGLNIRVTGRTDVWALLRRQDEALDKMTQYVTEILWTERDFLSLIALRIKASIGQSRHTTVPGDCSTKQAQLKLLALAFTPQMQWGDSQRRSSEMQPSVSEARMVDAHRIIYTLAYERPRWAVQLCKLARASSLRRGIARISKDSIDEVWGEYGHHRIADLVAEHKHQCPDLNELLSAFRGAQRLFMRDELMKWIKNRISTHMDVAIEGTRTRAPQDIAHFLYRIGFIVARSDNSGGGYEHYRFDQMPDFLSNRTDDDFSVKWEIHPCYRQALDIKKLDQSHRQKFSKLRQS